MKRKVVSVILATAMVASMVAGCGGSNNASTNNAGTTTDAAASDASSDTSNDAAATEAADAGDAAADAATDADASLADKKVGVCIYQFSDNFMTLFRTELENYLVEKGFLKDNITIVDGANDQATQTGQIDNFITEGVDVLIINPVNSSSAATITDKVVAAGIPLVYINREPDEEEQKRWSDNNWDVTYVGCDARQSGTFQGEMISDLGLDTVDLNGNGKIDYVMVEGDPDKLARVFDNLLRNAVAYSYRGTNIDVRAYGEGVAVVIVFSNQGEPIPKQKLQTVFEKFYRADNSRSSQTGGAGLGLSVAKEIVELHEGTIEAFSDIQSTRFVVRLKRLLPKGQRQSGGVI